MTRIAAIVLLGGVGTRFSSSVPKQFHRVGGKPLFLYTLEPFYDMDTFSQIILVTHRDWIAFTKEHLPPHPAVQIIQAGTTRQESSFLGMQACHPETQFVIIHDGVRPFVSRAILEKNLHAVRMHRAVDTCIPSADTLVERREEWVQSIPPRAAWMRGQTPQSFSYQLLLQAHHIALYDGIADCSDDCTLVHRLGHPIHIVQGEESNIKITSELDLFVAERMLCRAVTHVPSPSSSLQGKLYAVTGATGGIGRALCTELHNLGAHVLEISSSSDAFSADLTQSAQVKKVFHQIHKHYGLIHGLINCIGSLTKKDFFQLNSEEIEHMVACNLTSVLLCCRFAQIAPQGHIINIASSSYSRGRKEFPVYSASKAALVNFSQALGETRPDLHIHVLVPQRTNTALRLKQFPQEPQDSLVEPKEIVRQILCLLQDHSTSSMIVDVRAPSPVLSTRL